MIFDPLAWGLGFVLNKLSDRLLESCSSEPLRSKLCAEAKEWARNLPGDLTNSYEHIFGAAGIELTQESHPSRFHLQAVLTTGVSVPTESEWLDAFMEHWNERRLSLGPNGNLFFQLAEDEARCHLTALARRMRHVCQGDTSLALRSIGSHLEELVSGQRLEALSRRRTGMVPSYARQTSAEAQELILDRPDGWEVRLFSEVLACELAARSSLFRDYKNCLAHGQRLPRCNANDLMDWLASHLDEGVQFGSSIDRLINDELQRAFGAPGEPGDPEGIIYVAKRIGDVYGRAIEWSLSLLRISADPEFSKILLLHSRLVENMIRQMREFSDDLVRILSTADNESPESSSPRVVKLTLTLTIPEDLNAELEYEFDRLRNCSSDSL